MIKVLRPTSSYNTVRSSGIGLLSKYSSVNSLHGNKGRIAGSMVAQEYN